MVSRSGRDVQAVEADVVAHVGDDRDVGGRHGPHEPGEEAGRAHPAGEDADHRADPSGAPRGRAPGPRPSVGSSDGQHRSRPAPRDQRRPARRASTGRRARSPTCGSWWSTAGETQEWFHLVKPFLGGPDYDPFWVDVFQFLDVIHTVKLAAGDLVIDVGCGPGWTVQWLAKLGHEVVGLDISQELLDIAERRMQTDPYPPYIGQPFRYDLRAHDIEAEPLGLERKARLALFESTLHHFYNPVAALRNTVEDLADDGVVAVIEAAAPPKGSEWDQANVEIMSRYHTIERPYTRDPAARHAGAGRAAVRRLPAPGERAVRPGGRRASTP